MPKDKTLSHAKIAKVAMREFLDKGFEKVSMRHIANLVGMTQAALYRHYDSKEDMFCSLVDPLITKINILIEEHTRKTYQGFDNNQKVDELIKTNNVAILKELLPEYRDQLKLIICCSKGTKYENFIHDLVLIEQEGTLEAINYLRTKGKLIKEISIKELHILLSAYISAIFEPIRHDWNMKEILHSLDLVEEFFIPGWKKIMGF